MYVDDQKPVVVAPPFASGEDIRETLVHWRKESYALYKVRTPLCFDADFDLMGSAAVWFVPITVAALTWAIGLFCYLRVCNIDRDHRHLLVPRSPSSLRSQRLPCSPWRLSQMGKSNAELAESMSRRYRDCYDQDLPCSEPQRAGAPC